MERPQIRGGVRARYEREIAAAGGIDVVILGLGTNGHIGFNEPAPALPARTHRVTLAADTRDGNAELFGGDSAAVPPEALSMGIATILQARQVILRRHRAGRKRRSSSGWCAGR